MERTSPKHQQCFLLIMVNPGGISIILFALSFLWEYLVLYNEGRKQGQQSLEAYLKWEVTSQAQILEFLKHFSKDLRKTAIKPPEHTLGNCVSPINHSVTPCYRDYCLHFSEKNGSQELQDLHEVTQLGGTGRCCLVGFCHSKPDTTPPPGWYMILTLGKTMRVTDIYTREKL